MSSSIPNSSFDHLISSKLHGFSHQQIVDLTQIRDEFLNKIKEGRKVELWKTAIELIQNAFAPDRVVSIPSNITNFVRKDRNKDSGELRGEGELVIRIAKRVQNGLRTVLANAYRNILKQEIFPTGNDINQTIINWLIGKNHNKPGKIQLSFHTNLKQLDDTPKSERLATPTYETVDFFVYEYLGPVFKQARLLPTTGKRKRSLEESFESRKRVKLDKAESSSSSSSQLALSTISSNHPPHTESLLPSSGSLSSSSPLAPSFSFNSSSHS